jgi:hypothetical protein
MPTAYIETTIPSFYHTKRMSAQASEWRRLTRAWWDEQRLAFDLCTSAIVIHELADAPSEQAALRIGMLAGLKILDVDEDVQRVARYCLEHLLMPTSAEPDAYHVAVASVHAIDHVLTWNCRHIANSNKAKHLAVLNSRLSLKVPRLVTLYDLLSGD